MTAPKGRFSPLTPADENFTRRWVFPSDVDAETAISLFDEIKSMPQETLAESQAALKKIRKLNRLLKKMGLR